jgi:exonuclease SbcC
MSIRLLHFSDLHYSRENQERALRALETVAETAEKDTPDVIVIAGDLWDRPVNNTDSSGLPYLVRAIQRLMDAAPVVAVTGTPTHDVLGSYSIFQEIHARHRFTLLMPMIPYFVDNFDVQPEGRTEHSKLLVFGMPEPQKSWFLAGQQLGKEESNRAIVDGMRGMLLGMGAIREEHADLPCLFVGHLTVAGASISESQVLPPGGIQIGADDLALVGADYYALGHIHMGQQVGNLPACYAGSAFPVDWGERDQKHFNIAESPAADGFDLTIDTVPYPFLPRKKIVVEADVHKDGWIDLVTSDSDINGYDVWLQIRAAKEQRAGIDSDEILAGLQNAGAGPGSRVEIVNISTETVRSERITEALRLRDKVGIYAELSCEQVTDSILEKSDELELRAQEQGEAPTGLHIRIQQLVLRGAIGIKKGLGLDEVTVDLNTFDQGLIALVGQNGAGKTTLIENMHPYPQMLTRSGKLQDHFCLRDSYRDLYFIDENTVTEYRAFMQIDGANKSGSVEYFLYLRGNGDTWQPVGETNGRKDPYEAEVARLFGSLPLFLRSAFVSQKQPKNLPDLSEATKGEKKALFRELGGLDYLQTHAEIAKAQADAIEQELVGIRAKLEREEELQAELAEARHHLADIEEDEYNAQAELESFGEKGKTLKEQYEDLQKKVEESDRVLEKINDLGKQIDELCDERYRLQADHSVYESAASNLVGANHERQRYHDLKKQEGELNAERARVYEERERINAEYNREKQAVADAEREITAETSELSAKISSVESSRAVIKTKAEQLDTGLREPVTEECPTCGQKWPAEKKAVFEQKRTEKQAELNELQQHIFEADKELAELKKQVQELDARKGALQYPPEPDLPGFDTRILLEIQDQIRAINPDQLNETIRKADEAQVRMGEINKRLEQIRSIIREKEKEIQALGSKINVQAESEFRRVGAELEETRAKYHEKDKDLTRIRTEIAACKDRIDHFEAELSQISDLRATAAGREQDKADWVYLQRACGPDGIQALELDAMGPGIAEVANSILESAYGSRFQVEFRTTRIGGSGSKTKQIEDFSIWILDSETGEEQLLETLSGGESVWVKRAIYDAFGIIRARKTGTQFRTVFQDEADGALDPEARQHYFRMLERAHVEAGRWHTIVITHSAEAQEVIGQRIEMRALSSGAREEVTA